MSFDGQGFNKEFLEEYADKIEKNSGKIKSICAKNDYVNILLNSVAGETVYLENNNSELFGGHSPFTLWKTNKGDLRYGRFAHPVEQDEKMAILDVIADKFCNDLNNANWFVKTQLTDKIGIIVAYFFSESLWEAAKDIAVDMILDSLLNFIPGVALYNAIKYLILRNWLRDEIRSILAYIENGKAEKDIIKKKKKENASHSHHPIDIGVQPELMQVAAQQLDTCADKLSRILSEMDEIHLTGVLFNRIRAQIADVKFYISANTGRILREGKCLTDIARKYEATETSIVDDASQYAV